jgi:cytochrome c biogenesis protein ResB
MAVDARPINPALKPGGFDPLRFTWQLLCNVKFALLLVGLALLAGFIGIVIPQLPGPMRDNAAARSAWLELQRNDYGVFTDLMYRWGLFDVFHTPWFNGLWLLIIVAVTVCTVSRFRPTWRSVQHPVKVVGDNYFDQARHRASFTLAGGAPVLEDALRKRRYRVERTRDTDTGAYLFAERFGWSHYGTFLSHLALLMLLVGALLTTVGGFDRTFVLAEGTAPFPVFDSPGPNQIFVRMVDAFRGMDASGNIVDFHSTVEVRQGDKTITCNASVNTPCKAFGYKIHQAAFFNDVARLRITAPDGSTAFSDVVDFQSESTAVPQFVVTDRSGAVLFNQEVPQMFTDVGADGPADDLAVAFLTFRKSPTAAPTDTVSYGVSWRVANDALQVVVGAGDNTQTLQPTQLAEGQALSDNGYTIRYAGGRNIPAITVPHMPGAISDDGSAVLQMPTDANGNPYLFINGIDFDPIALTQGNAVTPQNGYSYTFAGQVEASGISVKRDPGSLFIWIAVGMALVGLAITFYVPRRRLWVKVSDGRVQLAGVAERTTRFSRELRLLGASLGAQDALQPGDLESDT